MEKIAVLSVTYGNRFQYVKKLVDALERNPFVSRIVIVDNNSSSDLSILTSKKLEILKLNENLGSAGGYKNAIKHYLRNPVEKYLLFLDDDNVISINATKELLRWNKKLKQKEEEVGLLCIRKEMRRYWLIAKGVLEPEILNSIHPFARFSIFDIPKRIKYRWLIRKNSNKYFLNKIEPIKINIGYWSGLFLERDTIIKNDLPKAEFFLYRDDHEYIYRLIKNGLSLYLLPSAELEELDTNWAIKSTKNMFSFPELIGEDLRAYYSVRNTVYFESFVMKDKSFIRKLNEMIYKILLFLLSIKNRKRYKLINKAIRDGKEGKLGINKEINNGKL